MAFNIVSHLLKARNNKLHATIHRCCGPIQTTYNSCCITYVHGEHIESSIWVSAIWYFIFGWGWCLETDMWSALYRLHLNTLHVHGTDSFIIHETMMLMKITNYILGMKVSQRLPYDWLRFEFIYCIIWRRGWSAWMLVAGWILVWH